MAQSGLTITPEIAERVGVFIGSGIGGFEVIEREHANLLNGGPRKNFALLYSRDDRQHGRRANLHSLRRAGANLGLGNGLRDLG